MKARCALKRRHRIAAIAASTLGASILLGGGLAPEAAAVDCQDALCVWTGTGHSGTQTDISDFGTGCVAVLATLSAQNEYGQTVSLYDAAGNNIVILDDAEGVSDTRIPARYACLGDAAAMNHNETILAY